MKAINLFKNKLFVAIALLAVACGKEETNVTPTSKKPCETAQKNVVETLDSLDQQYCSLNEAIFYTFKDWYLWYERIPSVSFRGYTNPQQLINAMRVPEDRWSFVTDKAENDALFNDGQYVGQGLDFDVDMEDRAQGKRVIRVSIVYPVSPAAQAGIYRGMEITKVNGKGWDQLIANNGEQFYREFSKSSITYELIDSAGTTVTKTVNDGLVRVQTVLAQRVINQGGKKIGYIMFNSFLGTAEQELKEAFSTLQANAVDELILDLRYNGGGFVFLANQLAAMIAGNKVDTTKTFLTYRFNSRYAAQLNENYKFEEVPHKLSLNRVFILGTDYTASASELVINCLKPYMEVKLIGDTTHGKPVGYFPFTYADKEIYPVSFESINANGQGEYYNGIAPNFSTFDGLKFPLGDVLESMLRAALNYISYGSFDLSALRIETNLPKARIPKKTGLAQIRGAR